MSAVWGVVYALTFLWLLLTVPQSLRVVLRVWPLAILPGIALLSIAWSSDVKETTATAMQFAFTTLLAIRIASALTPRTTLFCLFGTTGVSVGFSLLALAGILFQPAFETNGAFRGIFTQKTGAGIALTLFALSLVSTALLLRRPLIGVFGTIAIIPLILMTKSVSALAVLCGLAPILGFGLVRHTSPKFRLGATLFVTLLAGLVGGAFYLSGVDLIDSVLLLVGKSSTLTGRTEIWALGWEIADRYPFLGVGYAGFWENPLFAPEWGYLHATVDPRLKGFHNTYIEALATIGPIGLAALIGIYYWTLVRAFAWFVETGRVEALFWLTFVLVALALSFTDNVLFSEHELFHFCISLVFVHCATRRSRLVARTSWPLSCSATSHLKG